MLPGMTSFTRLLVAVAAVHLVTVLAAELKAMPFSTVVCDEACTDDCSCQCERSQYSVQRVMLRRHCLTHVLMYL
jgi:hypothetical protein